MIDVLKNQDKEVYEAIRLEMERERFGFELIPSENYVSRAVLEALGTIGTNKYSEGFPHKRYYGGNAYIDKVEDIAIERAKTLFGAEHANVQPYSGSPANQAAYFAMMKQGDKIMGLSLPHGGHLTHGWKVNFSGVIFQSAPYELDKETARINFDRLEKQAREERPKVIVASTTAYPRKLDFKRFAEIASDVDAYLMADIAHIAGLVIGGVHMSPFPYADVVTTTTHKTLRGPRGAMIMSKRDDRYQELYHSDSKYNLAKRVDKAVFPFLQGGPHNHTTSAIAVALGEAMQPDFKEYAEQIVKNAKALAETLLEKDVELVTGGTDNHLLLIDLTSKGVSGKEAEAALDKAHITVNKNMVPYDKRSAFDPSGIRIGTPALTTRGFKETEMEIVGELMVRVIENHDDNRLLAEVSEEVGALCKEFPLYPDIDY